MELGHCLTGWTNSLIGQILTGTFLDEGIAGFYYENPANGVSDDKNFVQEKVSENDGFDGENNDDRGHDDDDHDYHGGLYYLRGDEGGYDNDDQDDGDCKRRGNVYHLCICSESDGFHGHNDDDHDSRVNDDDDEGGNNRDSDGLIDVGESDDSRSHGEDFEEVGIYHGHYRGCALCLLSFRRCVEKWVRQNHVVGVQIERGVEIDVVVLVW